MKNIQIYSLDRLTELKKNNWSAFNGNYDNYLVVCYGENYGIWYTFKKILWHESNTSYLSEKLGIDNTEELITLTRMLNTAIREDSYQSIRITEITVKDRLKIGYSDNGLVLTNIPCIKPSGFIWSRQRSEEDFNTFTE